MSTDHIIIPGLEVTEQSDHFTIHAYGEFDTVALPPYPNPKALTADQLIDAALRIIQPALYHVDDVAAAKARIIAAVTDMVA